MSLPHKLLRYGLLALLAVLVGVALASCTQITFYECIQPQIDGADTTMVAVDTLESRQACYDRYGRPDA